MSNQNKKKNLLQPPIKKGWKKVYTKGESMVYQYVWCTNKFNNLDFILNLS